MAHELSSHLGAQSRNEQHRSRLVISLVLVGGYFVVELVAGLITGSLALLSDAGHMLTDVLGLLMALAAIHLAVRVPSSPQQTFGLYRVEILAALGNGLLLFGVGIYILIEASRRLMDPPAVASGPMLVVALAGLAVNLFSYFLLHSSAKENLSIKGAHLEVLADAIGSLGVIMAALVLETTGWRYIDPIVGIGIGLWILPRTYRLVSKAFRILVQAAPPEIDAGQLQSELCALEGVCGVHDLHLWTLASGMEVASAHIQVYREADAPAVMQQAQELLRSKYRLVHCTLQLEGEGQRCLGCSW
ncbi:MAG TPA: cation diffusion facilitator family transporter [Actinomycetota bacterium]|nr:cation diffusion facilitator family transporter [Actinomycetota bacterium]